VRTEEFPSYISKVEDYISIIIKRTRAVHSKAAAELNISVQQFVCLLMIHNLGKVKMSDLADYLALSYASTTNLVNKLVSANLVVRYDLPDDRRVVIIDLSEKGKEIITKGKNEHSEKISNICRKISKEDLDTMLKGLKIFFDVWIENKEPNT